MSLVMHVILLKSGYPTLDWCRLFISKCRSRNY